MLFDSGTRGSRSAIPAKRLIGACRLVNRMEPTDHGLVGLFFKLLSASWAQATWGPRTSHNGATRGLGSAPRQSGKLIRRAFTVESLAVDPEGLIRNSLTKTDGGDWVAVSIEFIHG